MKQAILEAEKARERGEVPIGAVIVDSKGNILASAGNKNVELNDPTAHAEMLAIKQACQIYNTQRLTDCFIYVTLEPCPMCAASISFARIKRLYFGAYDIRFGAVENGIKLYSSNFINFVPEIYGGIEEKKCANLLTEFFQERRIKNKSDLL